MVKKTLAEYISFLNKRFPLVSYSPLKKKVKELKKDYQSRKEELERTYSRKKKRVIKLIKEEYKLQNEQEAVMYHELIIPDIKENLIEIQGDSSNKPISLVSEDIFNRCRDDPKILCYPLLFIRCYGYSGKLNTKKQKITWNTVRTTHQPYEYYNQGMKLDSRLVPCIVIDSRYHHQTFSRDLDDYAEFLLSRTDPFTLKNKIRMERESHENFDGTYSVKGYYDIPIYGVSVLRF